MKGYRIENIVNANKHSLMHGMFICIMNAISVPPHILLVIEGSVYTLSTKGVTLNMPLKTLLRTIRIKQTKTLFVSLKMPVIIDSNELRRQVAQILNLYDKVEVGHATCLTPLTDFFGNIYKKDLNQVNFVFELLPALEREELIENCFHLNMSNEIDQYNSFNLLTYSNFEINESIYRSKRLKSYA